MGICGSKSDVKLEAVTMTETIVAAKAAAAEEAALEGRREVLGPRHPETLNSIYNLAALLKEMGRVEEAITPTLPLFREELEGCREVNGATHKETLISARNLAKLLDESGRAEEAARLRSEYGV